MPSKNYITPGGIKRLKNEALYLIDTERPAIVKVVHWAASNGEDRKTETIYMGKKN